VRGARSKSLIAFRSTSPTTLRCASATKRSTKRCTSKGRGALRRELVPACARDERCACLGENARSRQVLRDTGDSHQRASSPRSTIVPYRSLEGDLISSGQLRHWNTRRANDAVHHVGCNLPPLPEHGHLPRDKHGPALAGHGAEAVRDAITRIMGSLPEQLRRSLTWDQGAEMSQHAQLAIDTGLKVYFCDPEARGSGGTKREHQTDC